MVFMESIFWNVRSAKGSEKQLDLSRFLKTHNPAIVSLLETKLDTTSLQALEKKLNFLNSSFLSSDGRICILWNKDLVDVTVVGHSTQHVHCKVLCKKTQLILHSTTVYASNIFSEHLMLWRTLCSLSSGLNASPWVVGGDFNVVRFSSEKVGGRPVHARRLHKFNSCLEHSSLQDLKAYGHTLSWNNRQDLRIWCRLDRVLGQLPPEIITGRDLPAPKISADVAYFRRL
ncbi:hypothetical protein QJS10_CPA05g01918 [Acorus calamus]|uniref:Endonuclease/exonuclease/phosphatase domain-containing protein n=1 Tax=Acorus calamus TaxID=4465 RepID=A0AAV9ESQ4_ACOCL|nr:hypothetical protein QJS10_CPA05g01918 [Acorus calamus]